MKDANKTKKQLIEELSALRRRVAQLEGSAAPSVDEAHYRSMVEASPVAITVIRNGCILYSNPASARMLGFSDSKEMQGTHVLDIVAPESQSDVAERIKRLEQGKDNPLTQLELIRKDGIRIKVESTSVSVTIEGMPTAVIIAQDISVREEQEEKLQMMQFSIDHALDRIAWIAPDGRFFYANEAACKEMDYTLDEVLSMSVSDIDPNFPIEKWTEHYQEVKKRGFMRLETRQISSDGKIHDIEVSANHLKFADQEFLCAFGRDITERRRLEVQLKESEERFRAFMDNIPASVYIKDENDIHIYANAAASKSTKKKLEELVGSTTRELWPPDLADQLIELDQKVIDKGVPKITEEWKIREKGDARWQRDIKFPIILESGKKLLGGVSLDITEIKLSEQKLRKAYEEIKLLQQRLEHENIYLREEIELRHRHEEIIGESEPVMEMLGSAEQVARADTTVFILGETGTGKELLARAIHKISARKAHPMIKVNCAALPPTLIETELFGREKGAYTGALTKQKGRFELADGSTIFLDEISELPLELQPKLLRVLQEGCFERLGSSKTITVDARIMAATNQDLSEMVRNGRFREDLYYRLNVFPITVPPLRERQEDIPMLVWAFVKEFEETMARRIKRVPRKSMQALHYYPWPGNVRELRNVIEQAMIISKDEVLNVRVPALPDTVSEPEIKIVDVERKHILKILQNTGWRIKGQSGAAELLGLHPATLYSKMKRLGIQRPAQL